MTTRKQRPSVAPAIHAFTGDPPLTAFRCDGCGKIARDAFDLEGVEHYRAPVEGERHDSRGDVLCGHWRGATRA